jgi:iron(III) transport system substrate-binding protein
MKMRILFTLAGVAAISLLTTSGAWFSAGSLAYGADKPIAEKNYQELIEGAQKEGELVIWDTLKGDELKLLEEFKKKYPFIKYKQTLMRSADATERLIMESAAGRKPSLDVLALSSKDVDALKEKALLLSFPWSKVFKVNPVALERDNLAVAHYSLNSVLAYNTKLLSKDKLPKAYEDLLKPEWKGRIGLDTRGYLWTQLVATKNWSEQKGEDFATKMMAQKPLFQTGGTQVAQFLAAGQYPLGVTYLDKVLFFKRKAAPVEWIPLEPVAGFLYGRGIAKNALHPHAAILYVGWLATPEGQKFLEKYTDKSLPFPDAGTEQSRLLEGKKLALVGYGDEAERMDDMETKFMKIWGVK